MKLYKIKILVLKNINLKIDKIDIELRYLF